MRVLCFFASTTLMVTCLAGVVNQKVQNGGDVKIKGKGYVSVIDCRKDRGVHVCQDGIAKIKDLFSIEIREFKGVPFEFTNAKSQLENTRGNAAVFIIDDPNLPISLAAPEEKWTLLNVARMNAIGSDADKLESRTSKLFVRQCCFILGSDKEKSTETCFYPAFSVDDIDKIQSLDVTMSAFMAIGEVLGRLGIEPIEIVSYQDTCEMGIAQPPTNDVQRAIWDKVYAIPKNPMKIEFDPKKGR